MNRLFFSVAAAAAFTLGARAAEFTGDLYGCWYEDDEECGIWRVTDDMADTLDWRDDFIEVDGVKEPASFGNDEFAYSVTIKPGEKFTPQIIHGTSTAAHIKSVRVLSDAEMYKRYEEAEDEWEVRSLWPNGATSPTRAWILVSMNNVTKGPTYPLDLANAPIINDPDLPAKFYNPADGAGALSTKWTVASYSKAYGANISGTRELTQSVHFDVAIKETGKEFGKRVWNVCDPFVKDMAKVDKVDDKGGDEEVFYAVGLYYVSPEMIAASAIPPGWAKARTILALAVDYDGMFGVFELKCGKADAKKGTAKVSATLTNLEGKKTKYKSIAINVRGESAIAEWPTLAVRITGDRVESVAPSATGIAIEPATIGGDWGKRTGEVMVFAGDTSSFGDVVRDDLLPCPEPFTVNGSNWTFAKATSVKWAKDKKTKEFGWAIDNSKGRTNGSGLKLSYKPKSGLFKGSFKMYALKANGKGAYKLVNYSFAVQGYVVDGEGPGLATCKKPAAKWQVLVY